MRVETCKMDKDTLNAKLEEMERGGCIISDVRFDFQKREAWILYHRHVLQLGEDTTSPVESDLLKSAEQEREKGWRAFLEKGRPTEAI